MGLLDFLFGKKTTKSIKSAVKAANSSNTSKPSAKADIQIEDSFIIINSIDYFGMYEKSRDGNWLISWRDKLQGESNGEYLLYDLVNKRIAAHGNLERPHAGHVANNGTFSIEDWLSSSELIGSFNVFSSTGEVIFKELLQANILNSGISQNGLLAVCQTANNPNGDDSFVMIAVNVKTKSRLFKIHPATGWADRYDFDEDKLLIKVVVDKVGKFNYDSTGNFLDNKKYIESRLNSKLYNVAILACDEIMKADNVSIEVAQSVFNSATQALANGANKDNNYKPIAYKVQGLAQLILGNENEALKYFDDALKLNPKIGLKRKADSLRKKMNINEGKS